MIMGIAPIKALGTSVSMFSSSSTSAGGVTGVTISVVVTSAGDWVFLLNSSTAAHCAHCICFVYMYCCCGPTTLPGRTIRMNAIASGAVKPYFQVR